MTIIVYPVGNGDLGLDIVDIDDEKRKRASEEMRQKFDEMVDSGDSSRIADFLLTSSDSSRFSAPPLALILHALAAEVGGGGAGISRAVEVLLVYSESGNSGTGTKDTAVVIDRALSNPEIHAHIKRILGLDVTSKLVEGNLLEEDGLKSIQENLENCRDNSASSGTEDDVVINGISGATMVVFAAMAAADQLGMNWRLAVAPGEGKDRADFIETDAYDDAPFYWLRSLGYLEQAKKWAKDAEKDAKFVSDLQEFIAARERLVSDPNNLGVDDLARLLVLDVARADNGAGLLARPWVEQTYHLKRQEKGDPIDVFIEAKKRSPKNRNVTLGAAINEARIQMLLLKKGKRCAPSLEWLAGKEVFKELGRKTVHDVATPLVEEVREVFREPGVVQYRPTWLSFPGKGAVLYVVPCGRGNRGELVTRRVLGDAAKQELKRSVPGGMLEGVLPMSVEFLLLHSEDAKSKQVAMDSFAAGMLPPVGGDWKRVGIDCVSYEDVGVSEYASAPGIIDRVCQQVAFNLKVKAPAAVVVVGTGQKAAVFGALKAAQKWCAENAAPLFLQTFVDGNPKKARPQFHRIALHRDAKKALLKSAYESVRSFNLASAVRVLSAGDGEMDELSNRCDSLRKELIGAANNTDDPDSGAGILIDLLAWVVDNWDEVDPWTQMRLVVVVAEALNFKNCGQRLLVRGDAPKVKASAGGGRSSHDASRSNVGANQRQKVTHGVLIDILYKIRNKLAVTHGKNGVNGAVGVVLGEEGSKYDWSVCGVEDCNALTYPDLLRHTIDMICKAAPGVSVTIKQSDWKKCLEELLEEIESKVGSGAEK